MDAAGSATNVLSLAPVLMLVLAVSGLLAFTTRHRRVGTALISASALFLASALLL